MNFINDVAINAFSFIMLAIVYFKMTTYSERGDTQNRLFIMLLTIHAVMLIVDTLSRVFDGLPGGLALASNWTFNFLLYLIQPLAPALWMLYVDHQAYGDGGRLKALTGCVYAYMAANAALLVWTTLVGSSFYVDGMNAYHRGRLLGLQAALCYLPLLYSYIIVLLNRKKLEPKRYIPLLLFAVPPVAGAVVQIFVYGVSLIWSGMALSLLLIYLNLQDDWLRTDYLTGTYNRRHLDNLLEERIRSGPKGKAFSAMLIDLDDFKHINDLYGHSSGDEALRETASLLRSCLRYGDFIARYGGDEFLIVLDICDPDSLEKAVQRIRTCFAGFNGMREKPYALQISIGYAVYDPAEGLGAKQFVARVDALMYEQKTCLEQ